MGISQPRARRTVDSTRSRTPNPVLGPIEEVSETDVIDDRMQRRGSELEPAAFRLTFSEPQSKENSPAKSQPARPPSVCSIVRRSSRPHKRVVVSPLPILRDADRKPAEVNRKPHRLEIVRLERPAHPKLAVSVAPSQLQQQQAADATPNSVASSRFSQSNPSLHLTSSSSGISKESTNDSAEPKRKTYGQLATLVKCRQVIVTAARHARAVCSEAVSPATAGTVRLLSPKSVSWAKVRDHSIRFRRDSNAVMTPPSEIITVPAETETKKILRAKPPLYGAKKRRGSVQGKPRSDTGLRRAVKDLLRTKSVSSALGDQDVQPLSCRIKSWSNRGNGCHKGEN